MPKHYESSTKLLDKTISILKQQDLNGKVGLIVSGDSFIGSVEQRRKIKSQFPKAMALRWKLLPSLKHVINLKCHLL